MKYEIIV